MEANNNTIYHEMNKIQKEKLLLEEQNKKRRRRLTILGITLCLCLFSIINMISASFFMKASNIPKHLIYILMFLFIYMFGGNMRFGGKNYRFLGEGKTILFIFGTSMAILLFMFIGASIGVSFIPKINGAYGWINLGPVSIQPAEILKIAFIIIAAKILGYCEDKQANQKQIILYSGVILFVFGALIFAQQDLGTVIHYIAIWLFMLFISGIDRRLILGAVSVGLSIGGSALYYIYKHASEEGAGYKIMRIKSYVDGLLFDEFSEKYGYQVKQSVLAFGSGGVFGKGYSNGVQKYSYLPEIHTDFVMATFGEEFGIQGMFIVILLFFWLFSTIMRSGMETKNNFGKYLCVGVAGLIMTQMIINIFVAIGLLPVFGIPMPLFSYGGSSMVTMGLALAIVQNINKDEG